MKNTHTKEKYQLKIDGDTVKLSPPYEDTDIHEIDIEISSIPRYTVSLSDDVRRIWQTMTPIRYLLWCILWALIGATIAVCSQNGMTDKEQLSMIARHFPASDITVTVYAVRVFLSSIPALLLLLLSSLTLFSGAIVSSVLAINSLVSGVGVYSVLSLANQLLTVGIPSIYVWIYLAWILSKFLLTIAAATCVRRLSSSIISVDRLTGLPFKTISRYLFTCAIFLMSETAISAIYALIAYSI